MLSTLLRSDAELCAGSDSLGAGFTAALHDDRCLLTTELRLGKLPFFLHTSSSPSSSSYSEVTNNQRYVQSWLVNKLLLSKLISKKQEKKTNYFATYFKQKSVRLFLYESFANFVTNSINFVLIVFLKNLMVIIGHYKCEFNWNCWAIIKFVFIKQGPK